MSNSKTAVAFVAVIGLVSSSIAMGQPLSAGKPAGVKRADMESMTVIGWAGIAGAIVAGIVLATSQNNSAAPVTTSPVTTGTGTTS